MPNNLTLIDSSFLYALYNNDDQYHEQAVKLAKSMDNIPAIPEIILPEVTFLLREMKAITRLSFFLRSW